MLSILEMLLISPSKKTKKIKQLAQPGSKRNLFDVKVRNEVEGLPPSLVYVFFINCLEFISIHTKVITLA